MTNDDMRIKFRLSLCRMTFAEMEVYAASAFEAEAQGRSGIGARGNGETGLNVFRCEQWMPVPGKPGEHQWVKVEAKL